MKRTVVFDVLLFSLMVIICAAKPFAQPPEEPIARQENPFSFLTIIKLDEVAAKEDMDKVKDALRTFGYKVHSHKINFERKEVLIRMRQQIPNDSLISAFKNAGYHAWFDEKEKILPGDAVYKGKK